MSINIKHVEASSRRLHKAAVLLAEKSSGVPVSDMIHHPVIVTKGETVWVLISGNGQSDSDFFTPYIINGALSLEILLKWIYYIENNKWVRGHNLIELFQMLSPDSIKRANLKFDEICKLKPEYKQIQKNLKKEGHKMFHWGLASILAKSALSFEQWRYAFEAKQKSYFLCYGEIYETLLHVKASLADN